MVCFRASILTIPSIRIFGEAIFKLFIFNLFKMIGNLARVEPLFSVYTCG